MKLKNFHTPWWSDFRKPQQPMVVVSADSDFCQETVTRGWLTKEQMAHAAARYQLGKSRSGRCIFWMIDETGIVRDGHIGDSWVSVMLKAREPELLSHWHAGHCLYGLHLLKEAGAVCIVEKESSAVILSELFPDSIWLASVYPMNFNVCSFEPLCGREVVLFPSTDETMDNFMVWEELADQARRSYHLHIVVQDILERQATADQKRRKIDLVDFLYDNDNENENSLEPPFG